MHICMSMSLYVDVRVFGAFGALAFSAMPVTAKQHEIAKSQSPRIQHEFNTKSVRNRSHSAIAASTKSQPTRNRIIRTRTDPPTG